MKQVLFLCYYFPPLGMGGTQRSAKFVKYLPKFQWEPIVVTVKDVHYYAHDTSLLDEIKNCKIVRTESLDPLRLAARFFKTSSRRREITRSANPNLKARFLSLLNHFLSGWLLIPDLKILWLPFALIRSLSLIRTYKIPIVYTTSPPQSVHLGGLVLRWLTGIKWVADFRDDWSGGESQPSPTVIHHFLNRVLEKFALKSADRVIGICDYLTNNLKRKCSYRLSDKKFITVMNGYDRDDFSGIETLPLYSKFTITHCGSISRVSDPEPFLKAVQLLFLEHPDLKKQIRIQFYGTDIDGRLKYLLQLWGLNESIAPIKYLPHRESLKAIMQSHLLLLTIFKKTDEEIITSKIFEYLASGKPILLISSEGEVARIVRAMNRGIVVNYWDIPKIKNVILDYFQQYREGKVISSDLLSVSQFDREKLTSKLAGLFDSLI